MNAPTPVMDINNRVGQYVKLRDKIKELDDAHKATMKPYREALDKINGILLDHLNMICADNASTENGSVYRTEKKAASIQDKTAFWTYVVTQADWDMLDYKANVTAVQDFIDKNHSPPPGVNFSKTYVVGVRRK